MPLGETNDLSPAVPGSEGQLLGKMMMSVETLLAPREDSDVAIDREAGAAAGDALDRYRIWVSDHRVSAALLAALVATGAGV